MRAPRFLRLLLLMLTAALLLVGVRGEARCEFSCANVNDRVKCAEMGRDMMLESLNCRLFPDSTFLYPGGRLKVLVAGTRCSARLRTPLRQMYIHCQELKSRLDDVIRQCVHTGGGGGWDTSRSGWAWGVSAC